MQQQILQFINDYKKIVAAGLVLVVCLFSIYHNQVRYKEKVRALERTVAEWNEKMALGKDLTKKEQAYEKINEYLLRDFFQLKQIIDTAARKEGIVFNSLRQSLKGEQELFREISVEVDLASSYNQLIAFISDLEKNPAVSMERLSVDFKDDPNALDIQLNIVGLMRKTQ
jgi:Tfp pilus assembly protein PilO